MFATARFPTNLSSEPSSVCGREVLQECFWMENERHARNAVHDGSDKQIVQKWRGDDWPKSHYSLATFSFSKSPKGTKMIFTQKGIPADKYEDIKEGWIDYYWRPMEEMFRKSS